MRKLIACLVLIAALALTTAAKAPEPLVTHEATVLLVFADKGRCSGTIIGAHSILSASHCFAESPLAKINGKPAKVVASLSDGADHTIITVNVTFERWATRGTGIEQGTRVHLWGNPLGIENLYREGVVAGWFDKDWLAIDLLVAPGDSGSGLFDERGYLVGVVSSVVAPTEYFHLTGIRPFAFTPEQWASVQ